MTSRPSLSTADRRQNEVADAALSAFARKGYHGTTVADVANEAGLSSAYVFRLFVNKQGLFISALRLCFEQVQGALATGAATAQSDDSESVLDAMGQTYAQLIGNQTLLMFQVHALAATDDPDIRAAFQDCQRQLTDFVLERSGADQQAVQTFFARGQLCHFVVALGIAGSAPPADEGWAQTLSAGLRHPTSTQDQDRKEKV